MHGGLHHPNLAVLLYSGAPITSAECVHAAFRLFAVESRVCQLLNQLHRSAHVRFLYRPDS